MAEKTKSEKINRNKKKSEKHFYCENVSFAGKETYKRIRTNIRFSLGDGKDSHIIGITSAQPTDGKSLTSVNLAYSFAQLEDKRVLLIDCDMRRSSDSDKLGLHSKPGLSNILSGVDVVGDTKQYYQPTDKSKGFDFLAAGNIPPNPSELLNSDRMKTVLSKLSTVYDFILLDLPPVTAVADAQTVAALTDGMVIVVREGHCTKPVLDECIRQLNFAQAHLLGFILNGAMEGGHKKYGYGYGYGRGYGYGYGYGRYGYGSGYGYGGYGSRDYYGAPYGYYSNPYNDPYSNPYTNPYMTPSPDMEPQTKNNMQ